MPKFTLKPWLITLFFTLTACSSISQKQPDLTLSPAGNAANTTLRADAYSPLHNLPQRTPTQNRYLAEQDAQILAYRELARQLYPILLDNGLVVADQVLKDELFRTYVDLFLREAKVVDKRMIADRQKISLALSLTPRFYHCVSSTITVVSRCLQEDNKIQFTRLGFQRARLSISNVSCNADDCTQQLHVAGFSKEKHALDKALLNIGLYDSEWTINMGLKTILNYFLITQFIFN